MNIKKLKENLAAALELLSDIVPEKELTDDEYLRLKVEEGEGDGVPTFCCGILTKEQQAVKDKLKDEAREKLLKRKSEDLFDHDELTSLYNTLKENATLPYSHEEAFINYADFKKMLRKLCPKGRKMLNAKVFFKFMTDDPFGRVNITVIFNYAMRKTWLRQTRIGLSIYDEGGKGYIRQEGLDNYITELIPTLVQLNGIEDSLVPFYVCTAARKFFFFLDPTKSGKIKILDILSSGFIDELLDLRENEPPKLSNWFSVQSTMRVYGQYLNLDKDHTGMLRKEELINYGYGNNMNLTETFIDRVFQECLTFEGEMDYRSYLDFVLATEHRHEPQSIQYFFRILDIDQRGYLDSFTLHYFFKDILKYLGQSGADGGITFEDVKDEIFDMVKPNDPFRITLQDLIMCGAGATVIQILTDIQGFWNYEIRETLVPDMKNTDKKNSSQV